MRILLAALLAAGLIGFAHAEEQETLSVHEQHENPMYELGQVINCQAMHISLGHMHAVASAALAAMHSEPTDALAAAERERTEREIAKAKYVDQVEKEAVIPAIIGRLEQRGMKIEEASDEIDSKINELLAKNLADIAKIAGNPFVSQDVLSKLLILLEQQSTACDKFVSDTEQRHTI